MAVLGACPTKKRVPQISGGGAKTDSTVGGGGKKTKLRSFLEDKGLMSQKLAVIRGTHWWGESKFVTSNVGQDDD